MVSDMSNIFGKGVNALGKAFGKAGTKATHAAEEAVDGGHDVLKAKPVVKAAHETPTIIVNSAQKASRLETAGAVSMVAGSVLSTGYGLWKANDIADKLLGVPGKFLHAEAFKNWHIPPKFGDMHIPSIGSIGSDVEGAAMGGITVLVVLAGVIVTFKLIF